MTCASLARFAIVTLLPKASMLQIYGSHHNRARKVHAFLSRCQNMPYLIPGVKGAAYYRGRRLVVPSNVLLAATPTPYCHSRTLFCVSAALRARSRPCYILQSFVLLVSAREVSYMFSNFHAMPTPKQCKQFPPLHSARTYACPDLPEANSSQYTDTLQTILHIKTYATSSTLFHVPSASTAESTPASPT